MGVPLINKKGEQANICSNIKNTVPISKRDAVLQIALIDKDLIVKPLRFGPILVENVETIGQAEKLLLRRGRVLLVSDHVGHQALFTGYVLAGYNRGLMHRGVLVQHSLNFS